MYKALFATLCALSMIAPVAAQAGEVRNREIHQQQRIFQGVRNGTVQRGEFRSLERQEYNLNQQRERDLHDGDGRDGLSRQQAYHLNRDENRISHEIYRDKHNDPHHR